MSTESGDWFPTYYRNVSGDLVRSARAWVVDKLKGLHAAGEPTGGLMRRYLAREEELLGEGTGLFPECDMAALRDEFHRLLMFLLLGATERTRSWANVKRSDVVRLIATEAGYGPEVQHVEDTSDVLESIEQVRLMDTQFLRKLAKLEGVQFYVDHRGLHFRRGW